jgi:hypothetical protein
MESYYYTSNTDLSFQKREPKSNRDFNDAGEAVEHFQTGYDSACSTQRKHT